MKPITLQQLRQITGGRALSPLPAVSPELTAVSHDTRTLAPGSLYVAIRGENHDGHAFLSDAAGKGAIAALVEEEPSIKLPNLHLIQVPSTRIALGKLARFVRQNMTAKIIAIGGSNGKTGTKNLLDSVLSDRLRGSMSPRSFNNEIGVPMAIFPADENQDYLVLELGTNHHGEIRVLTNIALPDIAVITNCSAEHLEGLDDLMGVRREEASIIEGLNPKGLLVVNGDDGELLNAVASYPGKRITFGLGEHNDLFATDITCGFDGVHFKLNGRRDVRIPLLGRHVAVNALAAIAVARRLGLSEESIIEGLGHARGPDMRLQLQRVAGVTLINDAYNANPASMQAAIETLVALPGEGRRVVVLGDMRELGRSAERYHREMGHFVAGQDVDAIICVGEMAGLIAAEARQANFPADRVWQFANTELASKSIGALLREGDTVLLKASRYMKLELIASAIAAPATRVA